MPRVLLVAALILSVAVAQTADPPLRPDSTLAVRLAGAADSAWQITLPEGQTARLEIVEHQGLAGILTLLSSDGRILAAADLERRALNARNLLIPPGAARVRIAAANHGTLERSFEIRIGPAHPLTAQDRTRLDAERSLGEGELATHEQKAGYLAAAMAAEQQALTLARQLGDTRLEATAAVNLAQFQIDKSDLKGALESANHARDLWTSLHDDSGISDALNKIAYIHLTAERPKEADEALTKALDLARAAGDSRTLFDAINTLGGLRERQGKTDEAIAHYNEGRELAKTRGDRLEESDVLSYLCTIEHDRGHLSDSLAHGTAALEIAKQEGDRSRTAYLLVRLSNVYATQGDFHRAISAGEEALPMLYDPAAPFRYGNALFNLASYYETVDDYPTALKDFTEALGIFRKIGSELGQGYVLHGLANTSASLGDYARANDYGRQSADAFHKASNTKGEIMALLTLGGAAARQHQAPKAIEFEQQALAIARSAGFHSEELNTLHDLAESYFQTQDFHASFDRAGDVLALIEQSGHVQEENQADALRQQGRALRALHQYDQARESLDRAVMLYQSAGTNGMAATTLYELAIVDRDTGHPSDAASRIATALDSFDAIGAGAGAAEARMQFAASHRKAYDLAIDLAMRQHDSAKAFELSERARTRTLVDFIRGARLDIKQGVDPALLDRERIVQESLDRKHQQLTSLLASPHTDAAIAPARKQIADLLDEYQAVEAEIRRTSPRYSALVEPHPLSLANVQANLLDPQTALLEFWLGDEHSYGWLVTKTGCRGFELPARPEIEALARHVYTALTARNLVKEETPEQKQSRIAAADREFASLSADLSHMLLNPIKPLPTARRLWVVTDGALEYLPVAALPLPGGATPLISAYSVATLPSASVLAEVRPEIAKRPPAAHEVAIFADPVFRADDERVAGGHTDTSVDMPRAAEDVDLTNLPRLWFSRQEADAVAAFAPRGAVREDLDFDATRTEAKKPALADYRIVHFATHALLDSRVPELSGLVLSMVDRSGHPQDGFLQLHEIYNLKLNADLVVLSGCQTALGQEVRSEGLVGLARGFMYAGAPQVLASLWSVRDRATAEFMTHFYEALLRRHLAPEAALREAQLAMRKDPRWSQPYFWAAFTMQGAR